MTAEEFLIDEGLYIKGWGMTDVLTATEIKSIMEAYASQQRTEGIREGFEAARKFAYYIGEKNGYFYRTADDYLNRKK